MVDILGITGILSNVKLVFKVTKLLEGISKRISPKTVTAIIFLLTLASVYYLKDRTPILILPVVGVASFVIPIVLSFDDKYNLGTRLDNGEVRKAIAIALTVVYIIMLSLFFINVTLTQQPENVSTEEDRENASGLLNENNALILPFVQPAAAEDQPASINDEIDNSGKPEADVPPSDTENPEGDGGANEETGETDNSKNPFSEKEALADIYTNFLYVYILIIGFYFGSRVFEDFAAVRMTKELTGSKPEDLLKRRLAMGEISEDDYRNRIKLLRQED
ncbi:MAG: hypothetical protein MUE87_02265 [Methanothrix sp.]|jgi:uncharacterized membrane protein|nr:hypothetical protein [Methanothrix sp.]